MSVVTHVADLSLLPHVVREALVVGDHVLLATHLSLVIHLSFVTHFSVVTHLSVLTHVSFVGDAINRKIKSLGGSEARLPSFK